MSRLGHVNETFAQKNYFLSLYESNSLTSKRGKHTIEQR